MTTTARKAVALDVDGVLADFSDGWKGVDHFGDVLPRAVELSRRLSEFCDVLIWTTRCNPEVGRGEGVNLLRNRVRDWLDKHGFVYADIWTGVGRPIVAAFLDDRAVAVARTADHDFAVAMAKVLCCSTPPGCSMRHDTPELPDNKSDEAGKTP